MQLIAIADIYSDANLIQDFLSIVGKRTDEDTVLIIAGDIGIRTSSKNYEKDINNTISSLSKICKHIFYLPGDSDNKELKILTSNATNLDRQNYVLDDGQVKIGLLGLGGAPIHSLRSTDLSPYVWDESLPIITEDISTDLKINMEKIAQAQPDYIILVTHSPPNGIADRSKPITLREMLVLEDILEELKGETKQETEEDKKKTPTSIRHLGSRAIAEFVRYYKPDIHIFAHVHKEGGKVHVDKATKSFNVSHISPMPYRLTGRKFLRMNITKASVSAAFDHVILERNLPFDEFIETYL